MGNSQETCCRPADEDLTDVIPSSPPEGENDTVDFVSDREPKDVSEPISSLPAKETKTEIVRMPAAVDQKDKVSATVNKEPEPVNKKPEPVKKEPEPETEMIQQEPLKIGKLELKSMHLQTGPNRNVPENDFMSKDSMSRFDSKPAYMREQ